MNPAESQHIEFSQEIIEGYESIRNRMLALNSKQGQGRQGGVSHRYTLFDGIYRPHGMFGSENYFSLQHISSVDPSDSPIEQIRLIIQGYVTNNCIFVGIGNSQNSLHPIWGQSAESWKMWQLLSDTGVSLSLNGEPSKLISKPDKAKKVAHTTLKQIDKFLRVLEA